MVKSRLYRIHEQILDVMKQHPEGISEGDIRKLLNIPPEEQSQFGRRRRDLHQFYIIDKKREGSRILYVFRGEKANPLDAEPISSRLRTLALHSAHGRCQMCGQTIERHQITLVIDHKIPRDWGGKTSPDNLWAICEKCNHGKKNLFASMDSPAIRRAMVCESVHVRIGELLKGVGIGNSTSSFFIEFVARDQDDWHKRLRELRYLNWVIVASRQKMANGRVQSSYTLRRFTEWPPNPTKWLRRFEEARRHDDTVVLGEMKKEAANLPRFE